MRNPLISASIGNSNGIAMTRNKSKSWLLYRHTSIQNVCPLSMYYADSFAGSLILFGKVNVLVETRG